MKYINVWKLLYFIKIYKWFLQDIKITMTEFTTLLYIL